MKALLQVVVLSGVVGLLFTSCASSPEARQATTPGAAVSAAGPNWSEIDRTVERVRQREESKLRLVETERTTSEGFGKMTDEEYAAALDSARDEVRKAHPKLSDADVEAAAVKQADEARRAVERTFTRSASSTFELKRP